MVRTRSRTLSEISRSTLKKGEREKSSQVHETFRLKKLKRVSSINKCKKAEMVMEKLLCCRYFGESTCTSVFSVSQVKRLGRYL